MARNRKIDLATFIGQDCKFKGEMEIKGGIRIDGFVEGNIESDGFVEVGEDGEIISDIKAEECLIYGTVQGNIITKEAVELEKTARLKGDITAKILKIHEGAIFNGNSNMPQDNNENRIETELEK
jgi:cytoskeletal protein CcmA (bactofilin family)